MKQIDLFRQYKAETGKNKSDITLQLKTKSGKICLKNTYPEELKQLEMSRRFIDAFQYRHDESVTEDLTITDHEYVQWLESKLL